MTIFSNPAHDEHEAVHFFERPKAGLKCIIAVHSTTRGPAAGGCRIWTYPGEADAITDALRLSRAMSFKNALAELPAGGGKAVILLPQGTVDRKALYEAFGEAVDSLGGQYIAAEDVGTTVQDIETAATRTKYIAGLSPKDGRAGGDPSPWTAMGVFGSMETAIRLHRGRKLDGARVAVQGVGAVGMHLCRRLHEAGAKLIVADVAPRRTEQAAEEFGAEIASIDKIHACDVDVFAPCALGGVLNAETIPAIKASIVCGAANNQLARQSDGGRLKARGMLYCPDYLVNAGGIISVMAEYLGEPPSAVEARIGAIPDRLALVMRRAEAERRPTEAVADDMAMALIKQGRAPKATARSAGA